MSTQLLRFFPNNALANCSPCDRIEAEDPDEGRDDDDVCDITQSLSIAFEALRLNCSKKLSICTSIEFGVPLMSAVMYLTDWCVSYF